jgi:lipopolysaccharide biosynthesis glycosyltransferase
MMLPVPQSIKPWKEALCNNNNHYHYHYHYHYYHAIILEGMRRTTKYSLCHGVEI